MKGTASRECDRGCFGELHKRTQHMIKMPMYPLRFEPIYQYRLWGGRPGLSAVGTAARRRAHRRSLALERPR